MTTPIPPCIQDNRASAYLLRMNVPYELRKPNWRWLVWSLQDGKKPPVNPETGYHADLANLEIQMTFDKAVATFEANECRKLSGIGLVLSDDIQVIDIDDKSREDLSQTAFMMGGFYVEQSPSKGWHIVGRGDFLGEKNSLDEKIELFSGSAIPTGYITFTGNVYGDSQGKYDPTAKIGDVHHFIAAMGFSKSNSHPNTQTANANAGGQSLIGTLPLTDEGKRLIESALNALSAEDEPEWAATIRSLRTCADETWAKETARNWSRKSSKHDDAEFDRKWQSQTPERTNPFAIINRAKALGWTAPQAPMLSLPTTLSGQALSPPAMQSGGPIVPTWHLSTIDEVANTPPPEWLVKGVLPKTGLCSVFGASGSGKTFLALDLAYHIASGHPWMDKQVRQTPVLYIALEGQGGFPARMKALRETKQFQPDADHFRMALQQFSVTDPCHVSSLAAMLPVGCVVFIDTLARAAPDIDENSSQGMGAVIAGASELQRLIGDVVVLVHHTGKDTTAGMRGHSSLKAALDGSIEIKRAGKERSWRIEKSKDGEDGEEFQFELKTISIGQDNDGGLVTSCAIKPLANSQCRGMRLTGKTKFAFDTFEKAEKLTCDDGKVGHENWQSIFVNECGAENDESAKRAFRRAKDNLLKEGLLIARDGHFFRPTGMEIVGDQEFVQNLREQSAGQETS